MYLGSFLHYTVGFVYIALALFILLRTKFSAKYLPPVLLFFSFAVWSFGFLVRDYPIVDEVFRKQFLQFGSIVFGVIGVFVFYTLRIFSGIRLIKGNWHYWLSGLYILFSIFVLLTGYLPYPDFSSRSIAFWGLANRYETLFATIKIINNLLIITGFTGLAISLKKGKMGIEKHRRKVILLSGGIAWLLTIVLLYLLNPGTQLFLLKYPNLFLLIIAISLAWEIMDEQNWKEKNLQKINLSLTQGIDARSKELLQREQYLEAISKATSLLLESDMVMYREFIELIGNVANASRTYVFMNHTSPEGEPLLSQVAEYCKEGIEPQIDNPDLINLAYKDFSWRWYYTLSAGGTIDGKVSEFPESERVILEPQEIKAILVIPLRVGKDFYGFIGFDNCESTREWEKHEQELLTIAASNLAQKIRLRKLYDAFLTSEEKFKNIIEKSSDAIMLYKNKQFEMVNSCFVRMFGYTAKELNDGFGPENNPVLPAQILKDISQSFANGKSQSLSGIMQFEAFSKDGRKVECEAKFSQISYSGVYAVQGIIRDVTVRNENEKTIRQLSAAVMQSPVAIAITDNQGNITYVNPKFTELTGFSESEVLGKNPNILKSGRMSVKFYDGMWKTIKSGKNWTGEFINKKKNGQMYYEHTIISPLLDNQGNITHFIAIKEDITEKKETEKRLNDSREQLKRYAIHLQTAREEERKIISRELHDNLGQSLTAMRMELFRTKKLVGENNKKPENSKILLQIQDSIDYFDTIIESVREISRNIRPAVLNDLGLLAALEWLATEFTKRSSIPCKVLTGLKQIPIEGDSATGVFRIIQEALNNILKHSQATQSCISVRKIENQVVILVRDNGKGINQRDISNGKTLGILSMNERAALFNGTIEISGNKDKGTVVKITIPIKQS